MRFGYLLSSEEYSPAELVEVYVANMGPNFVAMIEAYGSEVLPRLRG